MDGQMKPAYQVRIWHEDGWWLARVVTASDEADKSVLNALTQARSLARIESMARDLIATILDASEDSFSVIFEYLLPGESGDLVCQAKAAREWLDAAQNLWHERSASAARVLAEEGYSLRETAALLGLSHQRVDQILGSQSERRFSNAIVFCEGSSEVEWLRQAMPAASRDDSAPVFVIVGSGAIGSWVIANGDHAGEFRHQFTRLLREAAARVDVNDHSSGQETQVGLAG